MLKIQELREIIRLVDQSSINEFNFEQDGSIVSIKKAENRPVETTVTDEQNTERTVPVPVVEKPKTITEPVVSESKEETSKPEVIAEDTEEITSPMVGTFYRKPTPESDSFVEVGSKIQADSIVCIVEAMKLFNEIEAELNGEIVEILVGDGELVEYGQPLFKVKTK